MAGRIPNPFGRSKADKALEDARLAGKEHTRAARDRNLLGAVDTAEGSQGVTKPKTFGFKDDYTKHAGYRGRGLQFIEGVSSGGGTSTADQAKFFKDRQASENILKFGRDYAESVGIDHEGLDDVGIAAYGLRSIAGPNPGSNFDLAGITKKIYGRDLGGSGTLEGATAEIDVLNFANLSSFGSLYEAQRKETKAFAGASTRVTQASRERAGLLQRTDAQRYKPRTRTRTPSSGLLSESDSFGSNTSSLLG